MYHITILVTLGTRGYPIFKRKSLEAIYHFISLGAFNELHFHNLIKRIRFHLLPAVATNRGDKRLNSVSLTISHASNLSSSYYTNLENREIYMIGDFNYDTFKTSLYQMNSTDSENFTNILAGF